jgi:hypothetical protein
MGLSGGRLPNQYFGYNMILTVGVRPYNFRTVSEYAYDYSLVSASSCCLKLFAYV